MGGATAGEGNQTTHRGLDGPLWGPATATATTTTTPDRRVATVIINK